MGVTLDDNWENGPMIRRAGVAAFGLYSACGLWIARHLTDGFVPADVAADLGTREWAAKLVDAGFWKVVEGGFQDLHYLRLNPSAEKVEQRRRADADRKARWRDRKSGARNQPLSMSRRDATRDSTSDTRRDQNDVTAGQDAGLRSTPAAPPKGGAGVRAPALTREHASARTTHPPPADREPAEHEPGCSYANTNVTAVSCSICAAIRAGPDEPPTNGGPADPDEARALARAVAARGRPSTPPPVAPDPPADPPRAGPPDDEQVWMSAPRRGLDYHRIAAAGRTGCDRGTLAGGGTLTVAEAADFDAKPCPRCWPPPTTQEKP